MSVLPEVKCRRCGQTFSALRGSCPNCGTRRVNQSGRVPAASPSTVKGTPAAERAESNTKWQMIFRLILVVAVVLAVIGMVSTSLNGLDGNPSGSSAGRTPATPAAPEITPEISQVIETAPTPTPTPTPKPDSVKVFFFEKETQEFTLRAGWEPVKLTAQAYPVGNFPDATFKWTISDDSVIKISVSDDTKECTCEFVSHKPGGVTLTCSCNGVETKVTIYTGN